MWSIFANVVGIAGAFFWDWACGEVGIVYLDDVTPQV